ncbi:hypothetical protein [Halalkalibacter akibai]|uniref:Glycosyltransferase n=1 Tax=Halalkalibacter akibai (strain ATCC 43226 / DSM 21942 / CIP 109018 / JCM 9157 / 1139) TaxID=1236973 RepID=W4QX98_HALA3|nr:hypothetical protein [Halalkalibacter akibai]GAE35929.1 glycosyltransferase [Halalkalibacter akibai JCM 9157]
MKKVLIVIDSLSSGGAEKSLISLLTSLDYEKYDVDLLMFSTTGLYLSLVPNEVKIQSVPQFIKIQQKSLYSVIRNRNYKELLFRVANSISLRNPIQNKRFHQSQITWKWMNLAIDKLNTDYDIAIAYSQGIPTYFVAEKVNAPKKLCWLNTDYKKANYNRDYDIKFYEKFNHIIAVSEINKEIFEDTIPEMRGRCVLFMILSLKN